MTGRHLQARMIGAHLAWLRRQLATGIGFWSAVVFKGFLCVDGERHLVRVGLDRRDRERARQIDTAAGRILAPDVVLHHLMVRVGARLADRCRAFERVDLLAVAHHLQLPLHGLLGGRLLCLCE